MEDQRVWAVEESLWTAAAARCAESIDDACPMVLQTKPLITSGRQAIDAVSATPR